MKEIELQNGMKAIVDDEDFERVNQFNWTVHNPSETSILVYRNINGKSQTLPRFILEIKDTGDCVTHKNKNNLDCRKCNLSIDNKTIVNQKGRGSRNSSSKYKGVHWNKRSKLWVSSITVNRKNIHLGYKKSEDEAAVLYNEAAKKYFGNHAYQNIIGEDNSAIEVSVPESKLVNRTKKHGKKSIYRGVSLQKNGRFTAKVKDEYIGFYKNEIEAAKAYNRAALELFGDKAILNDLEGME